MRRVLQSAQIWFPLLFFCKDCVIWALALGPEDEMTHAGTVAFFVGLLPGTPLLSIGLGIIPVVLANLLIAFAVGMLLRHWASGPIAETR